MFLLQFRLFRIERGIFHQIVLYDKILTVNGMRNVAKIVLKLIIYKYFYNNCGTFMQIIMNKKVIMIAYVTTKTFDSVIS